MKNNIFIVAGDVSGDRHAASLIAAIKKINPSARISSLGGENLKTCSDNFLHNIVTIGAFGFMDPLKQYFRLKDIFENKLQKSWDNSKPDMVILVDYYGFNIHVAREAKKRKIPVCYYISPQVWATRPGRIKKLAKYIDKMLVILPFEEKLYTREGVDATFVGHPLIDTVPEPTGETELPTRPIIGFFPGSRKNVIKRHLPVLEKSAAILVKEINANCVFFGANETRDEFNHCAYPVVIESDYTERRKINMAVTVSGTVCLENSLLGLPMVVFYKLSSFNYLLAKLLVRIPYITMVNILLSKPLIPELIQNKATPYNIANAIIEIFKTPERYKEIKKQLIALRTTLGRPGVSSRAANLIMNIKTMETA